MTDEDWEYYGRDGPRGIYELYRTPRGIEPPTAKFAAMERLRKSLAWESAAEETALRNEWLSGWFDFDDNRLTLDEAKALVQAWTQSSNWPGRE